MPSPRPRTPPPRGPTSVRAPLTPEQAKRIEINRLRAKAIFEERQREERNGGASTTMATESTAATTTASMTRVTAAGQKRKHGAVESTSRRGGEGAIRPAKKFAKFVDYDLSKMTDTRAGFMTTEDDPNSVLSAENLRDKPKGMSLEEWAKHQLKLKLRREAKGAFEPAISALDKKDPNNCCFECGSREIDWRWLEVFKARVCERCKKDKPEKYSLLTKTEAREDYMLTDPELRDKEILPHLQQPNPHKSTWSNMMLYLKYQVEEWAVKKWGSLEAMDEEYARRTADKKKKQSNKFQARLLDLKRKTRVEKMKKKKDAGSGRHEHTWGTAVENEKGETVRTCEECGFEVEELVF